jgi:hypothetical protein
MTTPDEGWQARQDRLADERQREMTAATLLGALTVGRMVPNTSTEPAAPVLDDLDRDNVGYAVALTDALRAALRGGL